TKRGRLFMEAILVIVAIIFMIIGLKGCIKSIRNKDKRVDKKTGVSIIAAILLVFFAILISDVEEADEQPKDEEVVAEEKTEKNGKKDDEPAEELTDADRIKAVVAKEISEDRIEDVTYFDGYTTLKIRVQDNSKSNMIQRSMWIVAGYTFEDRKESKYDGTAVIVFIFDMTTLYGESKDAMVMSIELSPQTLHKIDIHNCDVDNFPDVS